jgi:dTDP-4-amino-4,6-dideoxygalactose transaminase
MIIEKFKPIEYKLDNLNIQNINISTGKKWVYASNGKSALYHCLKSLNVTGKMLIPVYICSSVLAPLKELGIVTVFYDINDNDLNASINDLSKKIILEEPTCVLVASMYGNPAELTKIEELCIRNKVLLIDDAAQCFGAKTAEGRYVGTFGNAGFFSFSPGKPTSGHMGAFFWSDNNNYLIKRTKHCFFHYLVYLDFYFNRYRIYKFKIFKIFILLTVVKMYLSKYIDVTKDEICSFEKRILVGILKENENLAIRKKFIRKFINGVSGVNTFKIISKADDFSNNHKIVLLFDTVAHTQIYLLKLYSNGIYCTNGYTLLSEVKMPKALSIAGRVIEIPLENDNNKIEYLIDKIKLIDSNLK